jgi:hypothetical protein
VYPICHNNKKQMTQFYILRRFDRIRIAKNQDADDVDGEVLQGFENKNDLLEYCKDNNITLKLQIEYDDTWQNYAANVVVIYGYDYTIVTLDELISRMSGLKGESFTE